MELAVSYFNAVWLSVAGATERLHWIYLLTALGGAFISYRLYAVDRSGAKSFWRYIFPKGTLTSPSARMDLFIVLMAPFWMVMLIIPFAMSILVAAEATIQGLEFLFGTNESYNPDIWAMAFYTFMLLLAFDLSEFLAHYWCHRSWVLWEFHKIHHSAETLNPLTAYRFHPVDVIWTASVISIFTGACQGVFHWWWNMPPQPFEVLGLQVGVFAFYLAAYNLRHSHVWLPYPRKISHVFMSPAQHQIHHSVQRKHWDKNMGFIFSFWDWMFGTIYVPEKREELTYGIGGGEDAAYQSPAQVYILPFRNIARRLRNEHRTRAEKRRTRAERQVQVEHPNPSPNGMSE